MFPNRVRRHRPAVIVLRFFGGKLYYTQSGRHFRINFKPGATLADLAGVLSVLT